MALAVPVDGFENYTIDTNGNVFSLNKKIYRKPSVSKQGYKTVDLYRDGSVKRFLVHRLVAQAFIPNPYELPQVNHIDENPSNNHVENLEWCTAKYNMNYGNGAKTRHLKIDYTKPIFKEIARKNGAVNSKPVVQYDKNKRKVKSYKSIADASRATGIDKNHISDCCNQKKYRHTAGGFVWAFERRDDLSLHQF